jgi:hypothetical protein
MRCSKRRSRVVYHLVGAREVLHLGGLKIDVQRELGRSFDRDVHRLRAAQILLD